MATLAVVAAGIGVALVLAIGLSQPLTRITRMMGILSAGDTSVEVPGVGRRDEIGQIAAAVQVFKDSMLESERLRAEQEVQRAAADQAKSEALLSMAEAIESEISSALVQANGRTAAIGEMANDMGEAASRTDVAARDAADAAERALVTAQTVASAAEQLSGSIREIGSQVTHSTEVSGRAVAASGEARATIETLNTQVGRIGSVAEMINDIASKTNLLALNATIEAARAGDAGKGFAVVAGEVKQLAAQTARSTEEITRHIAEVRLATNASVGAVGRIEQTIGEMHAIGSSIAAAVEEQGAATAEIARNVAETASAAHAMTDRTTEFSTQAKATGRQAADLRDHTATLDGAIEELRHTVTRVVRNSSREVDRRRSARYQVDLGGMLQIGGRNPIAARVTDISEGGAWLTDAPDLPVGGTGSLRVDTIGFPLPFAVRASGDGTLHINFTLDAAATERFRPFLAQLASRDGRATKAA
jgi:methyl-accepting chemotaxis protein